MFRDTPTGLEALTRAEALPLFQLASSVVADVNRQAASRLAG